jgi:AraC-like DNA-binding protein
MRGWSFSNRRRKETIGLSPMDYLTRWRMMLAADQVTNSRDSIAQIGLALGYESEKSFSTAFKRVMNCPPRQYARVKVGQGDNIVNVAAR